MKKTLIIALAACAILPTKAIAQTTQSASATVTVDDMLSLTIDNNVIAFGTIGAPGIIPTATTTTATHSSNITYSVKLEADAANFTSTSGTNNSALEAGRLQVKVGSGAFGSISNTTPTMLVSSAPASAGNTTVSYRLQINPQDPKDTYTLGMTFSIIGS